VSKITNFKYPAKKTAGRQIPNKLQTTSTPPKRRRAGKFQCNSKLQAPHQKDGGQANLKEIPKFVILNFGYCDLFVICLSAVFLAGCLLFGI
jgi:hypothetical protein